MFDDDLRELIALRKELVALDDGSLLVSKVQTKRKTEVADGGRISLRISTPSVDSYGDIIDQGPNDDGKGWILSRYNGSPVVLWAHDHFQMNLSALETRALVRPDDEYGEALWVDPVVFDKDDDDAVRLENKVSRKIITEGSVGFVSIENSFIRDEDNDQITGIHFHEQELLETSFCNRGANPDTTTVIKQMLANHAGLSLQVDVRDNRDAQDARDDLSDVVEMLADRVRTLEAVVKGQDKAIVQVRDLMDSARVRAFVEAKHEQENAIERLLKAL